MTGHPHPLSHYSHDVNAGAWAKPRMTMIAMILCLTLSAGAAWGNPEPVEPHSPGGIHPPATHPEGGLPTPGIHPGEPHDPLHPEGPTPNHEPEGPGGLHPEPHAGPNQRPGKDLNPAHGNAIDPHPGSAPAKLPTFADTSHQYQVSMKAADEWQQLMRGAGSASTSVWDTLKRAYNKVMGNPMLPRHFGQEQSLPQHLQDLLRSNNGNYEKTLRRNMGDLDRELLRATYDKDYYREPLLGYVSYDKFVTKRGSDAGYDQIQALSPADRLQYLVTFGKQIKTEKEAAKQTERDLRDAQAQNSQLADLQAARDAARFETRRVRALLDLAVRERLDAMDRDFNFDDDAEDEPAPHKGSDEKPTAHSQTGDEPESPSTNDSDTAHHNIAPPATPPSPHEASLEAAKRHQIVWEATRKTNPDLFGRLSATYKRAMGHATLPVGFEDPKSLPEHLQTLLQEKGGYAGAMRSDIGDLDRELLRATFDKTYYQEPLMGYTTYAKFMAKYGEEASVAQVQKLSPADRLQYLANHGKQGADESAAIQNRIRDFQRTQQANAQMSALQKIRDEIHQQAAINAATLHQMISLGIDRAERLVDDIEDYSADY